MKAKLITAPAVEPLDIDEIKTYHRINGSDQDTLIDSLMTTARQVVEDYTGLGLIDQVWEGVTDNWCGPMELIGNVKSVDSVTYYDADDSAVIMPDTDYRLMSHGVLAELHLVHGVKLPPLAHRPDAITVRMTVGYGASAASVPKPIWQAMMLLFGHFYENRESTTPVIIRELPMFGGRDTVSALLAPYKVPVVR